MPAARVGGSGLRMWMIADRDAGGIRRRRRRRGSGAVRKYSYTICPSMLNLWAYIVHSNPLPTVAALHRCGEAEKREEEDEEKNKRRNQKGRTTIPITHYIPQVDDGGSYYSTRW